MDQTRFHYVQTWISFSFIQPYPNSINVYIDFASRSKVILINSSLRMVFKFAFSTLRFLIHLNNPNVLNGSYVNKTSSLAITPNQAFSLVYGIWQLYDQGIFFIFLCSWTTVFIFIVQQDTWYKGYRCLVKELLNEIIWRLQVQS